MILGENPKIQPENAKNRLKIVSKPLKIARKRHLLPKHGIFELKNMRRPQAGREILARHVNILPTFRRESGNSQHQHFGRADSTLSLWLVSRLVQSSPSYILRKEPFPSAQFCIEAGRRHGHLQDLPPTWLQSAHCGDCNHIGGVF